MKKLDKHSFMIICAAAMLSVGAPVSASSCEAYPYSDGIDVEAVASGTKIVATASAPVSFDDVDSIKDARDEAAMEAKAMISKFMTEDIQTDSLISKTVNETKSMTGNEKAVLRKETIERVKRLRNSSRALLRGVVTLGDCYTSGREVRVTVGIKPETIASAGKLAGGITDSISRTKTPSNASLTDPAREQASQRAGTAVNGQGLQGMEGYANTKRLDNF